MRGVCRLRHLFLALLLLIAASVPGLCDDNDDDDEWANLSPEEFLVLGEQAILEEDDLMAIELLERGLVALANDETKSLLTGLSLETNLAEVYVAIQDHETAFRHYESAIEAYGMAVSTGAVVDDDEDGAVDVATVMASRAMMSYASELIDVDDEKALEMYQRAVATNSGLWLGWARMARFLEQFGDFEGAIEAFRKAFQILKEHPDPTDADQFENEDEKNLTLSHLQLAIAVAACDYHGTADPEKPLHCEPFAVEALRLAVQLDPTNIDARQILASADSEGGIKAEDLRFEDFFDDFAVGYDEKVLETLEYQGYKMLRSGFDQAFGGQKLVETFEVVLDAGSGTGLVGTQFRNVSTHLIGVDISEAMIEEGKKSRPGLYDELIVGDVLEAIEAKKPIDLIVSADFLQYLTDWDPFFASMSDGLSDNGFAAFTVEHATAADEAILDRTNPGWTYQVTQAMRFAHRREYVVELAQKHGLKVHHREKIDGFRKEMGVDVRGEMFVLQKPPKVKKTSDEL